MSYYDDFVDPGNIPLGWFYTGRKAVKRFCAYCSKEVVGLENHIRAKHPEKLEECYCPKCDKCFYGVRGLMDHDKDKHG